MIETRGCQDIIRQNGESWHLSKGSLTDKLAVRSDGGRDCLSYVKVADEYILVPNSVNFNDINEGSFTVASFVYMPVQTDDEDEQSIISKEGEFDLFIKGGHFYFRIGVEEAEVSTALHTRKFSDNKSYLVTAWRDSRFPEHTLNIEVFGHFKQSIAIDSSITFDTANDLHIAGTLVPLTQLSGVYFVKGHIPSLELRELYWREGRVPANDLIIYQLDEAAGALVYDASGLGNHGFVINYVDDSIWKVNTYLFNWANTYGYSTGQYAIDAGFSSVSVGGSLVSINADSIIPVEHGRQDRDAVTGQLKYSGKYGPALEVRDALCFKGDGLVYGEFANQAALLFDPLFDEYSFLTVLNAVSGNAGMLIELGNAFKLSYVGQTLTISVYSDTNVYSMDEGENFVTVNFIGGACSVYINSALEETFTVTGTLLSTDVILMDQFIGELPCMVFRNVVTTDTDMLYFSAGQLPTVNLIASYFPVSGSGMFYDISGGGNHIALQEYISTVWSGRQSSVYYFMRGLDKVINMGNQNEFVYVPLDVRGESIIMPVYAEQKVVRHSADNRLVLYDYYLDFNPDNLELGFYSRMWDKTNIYNVWAAFNAEYVDPAVPYYWNVLELDYLDISSNINYAYRFFIFTSMLLEGGRKIGLSDVVLMNLGNNLEPVRVPLDN